MSLSIRSSMKINFSIIASDFEARINELLGRVNYSRNCSIG